jgi:hypothetical protein
LPKELPVFTSLYNPKPGKCQVDFDKVRISGSLIKQRFKAILSSRIELEWCKR